MQDVKELSFNDDGLKSILDQFGEGEGTKQTAFGRLIDWCKAHLEPFKKERGGVARGAVTALRNHVEMMDLGGLTTSYIVPSVTIASAVIKGSISRTLEYILENLDEEGSGEEGHIKGPLFVPGRLNACWGLITKKDGSPFEVTMEGLMLKGKPFSTYRIKDLKEVAAGPEVVKSGVEKLLSIVGEDPRAVKDPDKAKAGTLGSMLKKLREDNTSQEKPDKAVESFCDSLEGFLNERREELSIEVAVEEEAKAAERRMKLEERRRKRAEGRTEVPESSSFEEKPDKRRKPKASEAKK